MTLVTFSNIQSPSRARYFHEFFGGDHDYSRLPRHRTAAT
jgi:hypothetical protein